MKLAIKKTVKDIYYSFPWQLKRVAFYPVWKHNEIKAANLMKSMHEGLELFDRATREILENKQVELLNHLLKHSVRNVPFYRERFAPFLIEDIDFGYKDLEQLPTIDKFTVRENLNSLIADGSNINMLIPHQTGGSTGIPLTIYYDKKTLDYRNYAITRWMYNADIQKPRTKMVWVGRPTEEIWNNKKLWGEKGEKCKGVYDAVGNNLTLFSTNLTKAVMNKYLEGIEWFKPQYIQGYASAIAALASHALNTGKCIPIQVALVSSDCLTIDARKKIETAFACSVFERYGLGEEVASAIECELHNGMHIDMDKCVIEVLDSNGKQVWNEIGDIVCTGLINYSMPLIRYKTGDRGIISTRLCGCGRQSYILEKIVGRVDDVIILDDGRKFDSATLTSIIGVNFDFFIDKVREIQLYQKNYRELELRIAVNNDRLTFKEEQSLKENIINVMQCKDIQSTFKYYDSIPRGENGKLRYLISDVEG